MATLSVAITFVSCKKGENDPLSLESRKNRLEGYWTLVSGNTLDRYYNAALDETQDIVKIVEGETQTSSVINFTPTGPDTLATPLTYEYHCEFYFDKKGNFTSTEVAVTDSLVKNGFWYFTGKNKPLGLKNKEAVEIVITEKYDGSTELFDGTAMQSDVTWYIDRLAKRELTLLVNVTQSEQNGDFWQTNRVLNFVKY